MPVNPLANNALGSRQYIDPPWQEEWITPCGWLSGIDSEYLEKVDVIIVFHLYICISALFKN